MLKSVAIGGVRKWECFAGTCVRPSSRDGNFSIPELALVLANVLKGEFSFFYDSIWFFFLLGAISSLELIINWKSPIEVANATFMPRLIRSFLPATISNYEFTSHGGK